MTIVVLVLLAALWVVVLAPSVLRERARRRSTNSVIKFRRQLRVIQRAAPPAIPAANRRVPAATFPLPSSTSALVSEAAEEGVILPLVQAAELGKGRPGHGEERPDGDEPAPGPAVGQRRRPASGSRREAPVRLFGAAARPITQRRRQVALGLVMSVAVTLLLGLVPGLRPLWWASLVCLVGLGAYLFALARLRALALERRLKLAYLPPHEPKQSPGRRPPLSNPEGLLRRSATS